ncbi:MULTISPECIES: type II secretion system secretin GspD [unclassified Pseudomonas]|uniref:type II secretion system secretin GspD n=1 Tax=unclassified Pseudomonas TaxID=196821 RepID=UPI00244C40B1|nr:MULTISPECIES: type II secretion system secretin GspD [unclassified Pseudomonas]MDG9926771.1 type II secretion system secretin GspD [Pseudomonas sp. GD04042]MDH0482160.1 type II secretion system secretin GspD [Pseudomonas sp. GD04015]MDH0603595.1 type II secretion system secretin GspD [Pseudomonas sp. GD03869]
MNMINMLTWRPAQFPLSALCVVLLLAGCSTLPSAPEKKDEPPKIVRTNMEPPPVFNDEPLNEPPKVGRTLLEQKGDNQFVAPVRREQSPQGGPLVNVKFESAPMLEVVAAVLGDMLKVPYTIEGAVEGNITLVSSNPVPETALIEMLESLLESRGVAMLKGEGGIYRIGPVAQLRKDAPVVPKSSDTGRGYSVQIVPLRYLTAGEALKILEPLGMKENVLRADPVRNILMLGASAPQMQNALRTLQTFDVDVLKGMSFGIYEVLNLDAKLVVDRFNALLGNEEASSAMGAAKLVAMEEINSVMVIAARSEQLVTIGSWIKQLDRLGMNDSSDQSAQMYVYSVQNGEAKVLAGLLGQIFGGKTTGDTASTTSGSTAPGLTQAEVNSEDGSSSSLSSQRSTKTGGVTSTTTEAGSRIVADESTNSLLVMAAPREWQSIRSALEKIDKTPAQVLVEVSIWEVTLNDKLNYGVEWFFNTHAGGGDNVMGGGRLSMSDSGAVARSAPGFSYIFTGGDWRAVINMLSSTSRVKSLSSPSILVLDNREASIQVGTQQPISTGTTTYPNSGSDATSTQNYTLKDTGVQLKVKPRVNSGGLVLMDIQQEVTDVGAQDEVTKQRSFLKRTVESSVAIQSGDTIILGGLIQDSQNDSDGGVPYLHKLPIIGPLFGTKGENGLRTELLVTISPRAVTQYKDFERIGQEFQQKMRGVTDSFRAELEARP